MPGVLKAVQLRAAALVATRLCLFEARPVRPRCRRGLATASIHTGIVLSRRDSGRYSTEIPSPTPSDWSTASRTGEVVLAHHTLRTLQRAG